MQKSNVRFGSLLLMYRKKTIDKEKIGILSRNRFGIELGKVLGTPPISQDVIYKLETDKTKLRYQDRNIVKGIIRVLLKFEGISKLEEANLLLAKSHNEPLSEPEIEFIHKNWLSAQPPTIYPTTQPNESILYDHPPYISRYFEESRGQYNTNPPEDSAENTQPKADDEK